MLFIIQTIFIIYKSVITPFTNRTRFFDQPVPDRKDVSKRMVGSVGGLVPSKLGTRLVQITCKLAVCPFKGHAQNDSDQHRSVDELASIRSGLSLLVA